MSTLSLPPIATLAEAAADLVIEAGDSGNVSRVNGLNKAALFLHEGVQVTLTCGGVLIPSATRGMVHRVDNVRGCSCESARAGRCCWHVLLVEIIERAQMRTRPTMPALGTKIAAARKALELVNELY